MMDLESKRAELLREMKITKGARFNASERLGRRDRRIITVTAFASVYVILLTILPMFVPMGSLLTNISNFITIIFSLIILAASLLQYSNNDPVRAEQHHRCGLEINALRRALRATDPLTEKDVFNYGKQYDEILQKYSINHDPIDLDRYKKEHPSDFSEDDRSEKTAIGAEVSDRFLKKVVFFMSITFIGVAASIGAEGILRIEFVSRILGYSNMR